MNSRKSSKTSPDVVPETQATEGAIEPRARPVILAAQALKILRDHVPGSSAVPVMPKLRWCMDGLLLLQRDLSPLALDLFSTLDLKVQVLTVRLATNPRALDAVLEELIERLLQLGDVLMDDLMRPREEGRGIDAGR